MSARVQRPHSTPDWSKPCKQIVDERGARQTDRRRCTGHGRDCAQPPDTGEGHTYERDDQHVCEELATAAAIYILPASIDQELAFAEDNQLRVMSVQQMLAESTFEAFRSAWSPWGTPRTKEASRLFASWSGGE